VSAAPSGAAPAGSQRTLVLTGGDVARLMDMAAWLDAAETAFRALAEGRAEVPAPMAIAGVGGTFHAKGAWLAGARPLVALKLNGNFPGNPAATGLPTIQGALLLCDGADGRLLAIVDSIAVTLWRTAAASALAARHLARPDSATLMVCGCGAQGSAHLAALRGVLPLTRCLVWDRAPGAAERFAAAHQASGIAVEPAAGLAAAAEADVIACCTSAAEPYLGPAHVRPGTFVAAVGADSPHKSEIEPALMARARIVADIAGQAEAMGDLRHALAAGAVGRDRLHAELGDLVAGRKPGRASADEITLFDSTGTAIQDVTAAAEIWRRAMAQHVGAAIALGAPA
jgi:ornithine cyclodeaminase/alanine dehydrogenase-like protein (mu-crystallin family)